MVPDREHVHGSAPLDIHHEVVVQNVLTNRGGRGQLATNAPDHRECPVRARRALEKVPAGSGDLLEGRDQAILEGFDQPLEAPNRPSLQ